MYNKEELAIKLYGKSIESHGDIVFRDTRIRGPLTYKYEYELHHNYEVDDEFSTAFNDLIWLCNLKLMSMEYIPGCCFELMDRQLEKIYFNRDMNAQHKFIFN